MSKLPTQRPESLGGTIVHGLPFPDDGRLLLEAEALPGHHLGQVQELDQVLPGRKSAEAGLSLAIEAAHLHGARSHDLHHESGDGLALLASLHADAPRSPKPELHSVHGLVGAEIHLQIRR